MRLSPAPVGSLRLDAKIILIEAEPSLDPPSDDCVLMVQPQLLIHRKKTPLVRRRKPAGSALRSPSPALLAHEMFGCRIQIQVSDSRATVYPGSLQEGHFALLHLARSGPDYSWKVRAIDEMNLYR